MKIATRIKAKATALIVSSLLLTSGCTAPTQPTEDTSNKHEMTTFAMDTVMTISIYHEDGEALLTDAEQEIRRLERLFSVTMDTSDVSLVNENAGIVPVSVAPDTIRVLQEAAEMNDATEGRFNITVSPLVQAWGFTTDGEKHVPPQEEINQLLDNIDIHNLKIDTDAATAFLEEENMGIDLGGIAKGFTSDRVAELLEEKGVASGVLALGGNIHVIGRKPSGEKWTIAVASPLDASDYVGTLAVENCSVITSGSNERFFEEDGKVYHHIIDPETGYPSESGLLSVTIVSDNGAEADSLSTALFIMGLEDALAFWREDGSFEAIFITEDGRVLATEGLEDIFYFEGRDNDFTYEVVTKQE